MHNSLTLTNKKYCIKQCIADFNRSLFICNRPNADIHVKDVKGADLKFYKRGLIFYSIFFNLKVEAAWHLNIQNCSNILNDSRELKYSQLYTECFHFYRGIALKTIDSPKSTIACQYLAKCC